MTRKSVILLVEDDPNDELLTLRALRKTGVEADFAVAHDGGEALQYLHGNPPAESSDVPAQPSLVLLDLKLPQVDGLEVLRTIRSDPRTTLLPVVVLSSSDEPRDVEEAYRLRTNSYIRKPVNFVEFNQAADLLVRYWLSLNELPPAGAAVTPDE